MQRKKDEAERTALALWGEGRASNELHALERVREAGRGLIARAEERELKTRMFPDSFHLVYYPRPEHARQLAENQAYLVEHGPAEAFPGSVGSMHAVFGQGRLKILTLQGSFRQKKPELPRALATKYGGWRQHLLHEAFEFAKRVGMEEVELWVPTPATPFYKTQLGSKNAEVFKSLAAKHGYSVTVELEDTVRVKKIPKSGN